MNTISINRKQYINFRMRKLISNFIKENSEVMEGMTIEEKAKFISEGSETIVCENYFIKDKRRVEQLKKVA